MTPKKRLTRLPNILARNQYDRLSTPPNTENMDASTLGGIIFASKVKAHMVSNAKATVSVKSMTIEMYKKGSIPNVVPLTKKSYPIAPIELTKQAMTNIDRIPSNLEAALKTSEPKRIPTKLINLSFA